MWRFVPTVLRGRLPSFVGSLVLVPPVFHAMADALGWLGDIDLVISKYEDPGWIGKVLSFLVNPPGWFLLLSVAVGLGIIWWDAKRAHPTSASAPVIQTSRPALASDLDPPAITSAPSASSDDASRFDAALYAMYEVLTDAQVRGYEIARHVPADMQNIAAHPQATHGVSSGIQHLAEADQALVVAIQRLHDIQFRQFRYFGDELRAIFDNGPISAARQAIFNLNAVLKEIPERPTAGLLTAIQPSFDDFEDAMAEFGRWISDRMRVIQERRATSSA